MPDEPPSLHPPNADTVYAHYIETSRRLGVEPTPRERADELICEWSAAIERGGKPLH